MELRKAHRVIGNVLRWPELWFTPLLGTVALTADLHFRQRGVTLYGSWFNVVLAGLLPLLAIALVQGLLRTWKWWGLVRAYASAMVGCLTFGLFYGFVLFPAQLPHVLTNAEMGGDLMTAFDSPIGIFACVGSGIAMITSLFYPGVLATFSVVPASR